MGSGPEDDIVRFNSHGFALQRIVFLVAVFVPIPWLVVYSGLLPTAKIGIHWPLDPQSVERLVFVSYLMIWCLTWHVYFASGTSNSDFHVRTLRRLLKDTSEEWTGHEWENPEFFKTKHHYYDDMASKSLTSIAVMVGASIVVLTQVHGLAGQLHYESCRDVGCDYWNGVLTLTSAVIGAAAVVGYVLALDLMDSLFTKYRSDETKKRLQNFFFMIMVDRRYPAMVCLLTSISLIAAANSPYAACFMIAIFLTMGYSNWFPIVGGRPWARVEDKLVRMWCWLLISLPAVCWAVVGS